MRRALWLRTLWASETNPAAHPAAIQHEEVDRILADPAQLAAAEAAFYRDDEEARGLTRELEIADERLRDEPRWQSLAKRLGLSAEDRQLFAVATAVAVEPQLGRVYAYLHDQPEMTYATPWLAAALLGPGAEPVYLDRRSALVRTGLLRRLPEVHPAPPPLAGWSADPLVAQWIVHGGDADLPNGTERIPAGHFAGLPPLYPEVLAAMQRFAEGVSTSGLGAMELELAAPEGSGKRTLAGQFAAAAGKPLLVVKEAALLRQAADADIESRVLAAVRAASLHDAVLYWESNGDGNAMALETVREAGRVCVIGRANLSPGTTRDGSAFRAFELPPLNQAQRLQLWGQLSVEEPPRQIREWLLTPSEIVGVHQVAGAGDEAIRQACRRPVESANLLVRLPQPFEAKDLVVQPGIEQQLKNFEEQVRHRWAVYEEWGFDRLCPNGRGIIGLFAGPSGTGKTMAAQVLARSLGMELYRLDPANVVNKYIGETEKRLKVIFDECDRANFLLLIDECEGMFGQRFSSKDAHDRYANLEIDYLLQRLERFQGVAILATNRKGDLDAAFQRRIRLVIDFLPPGPAERLSLWRKALLGDDEDAAKAIVGDVNLQALAEKVNLTGAEIKLAALNSAFLAKARNSRIEMEHVLGAVRAELRKKGQTLRGFE